MNSHIESMESMGRLGLAVLLGSGIGIQRQWQQKTGGSSNPRLGPLARLVNRGTVSSIDAEIYYTVTLTCKNVEEAHLRSLLMHAVSPAGLGLRRIDSADVADTSKVIITASALASTRNAAAREQIVGRLSLEPQISAAACATDCPIPEA